MIKKILAAVAAVILLLVIVIALQPSRFRVTRSATIAAPQADVFAQVNDFHKWEAWSPWAKLDPAAKNAFEGPTDGVGAALAWDGNSDVGEGRMTITESHPHDLVRIKLDFVRPFEDTCDIEFTFKPEGDQTLITWTMSGEKNFIAKAMGLVMNCDKMVGDQFEQGLANMKSVVERTQ